MYGQVATCPYINYKQKFDWVTGTNIVASTEHLKLLIPVMYNLCNKGISFNISCNKKDLIFITEWLYKTYNNNHINIVHNFTEGDYTVVHIFK